MVQMAGTIEGIGGCWDDRELITRSNGGEVMTLIRGLLLVACFSVPVFGQEAEDRREVNFVRADLDQDGHVSREEFKGNQDNFNQFDTNGDGFVTREEFGLKPVITSTKPAVVPSEQTEEEERLMAGDNENTTPQAPQSAKGISIPLSVSPIHELRTTSEDGKTAEASYRMPPGDGPFPAIVFEHGGLGFSKQETRQNRLIDGSVQTRFLSMGYVAVEGTRRDHNDNPTDPGPILDYKAIVDAVGNMDKVDAESIVVMGGSGGGTMTLDLISITTVSAAVAGEPASVIFAGMLTKPARDRETRYEAINDPAAFWTPEIVANVRDKVSRFETPLLILHGDIHPLKNVNMDYVFPEIKKAGKTMEVKVYPGKNHGFYWGTRVNEEFIEEMIQDIQDFADEYLKTKPVAMDSNLYSAK